MKNYKMKAAVTLALSGAGLLCPGVAFADDEQMARVPGESGSECSGMPASPDGCSTQSTDGNNVPGGDTGDDNQPGTPGGGTGDGNQPGTPGDDTGEGTGSGEGNQSGTSGDGTGNGQPGTPGDDTGEGTGSDEGNQSGTPGDGTPGEPGENGNAPGNPLPPLVETPPANSGVLPGAPGQRNVLGASAPVPPSWRTVRLPVTGGNSSASTASVSSQPATTGLAKTGAESPWLAAWLAGGLVLGGSVLVRRARTTSAVTQAPRRGKHAM